MEARNNRIMRPHICLVDGMNFLHRSRTGWTAGPAPVVFNFFRNIRALVEKLDISRLYFVLEGHPQARHDILPQYKANRIVEAGTKEHDEMVKFFSQVDEIVGLLAGSFPFSVVRHPHHECDDTIYNLIKRGTRAVKWTVVSNDSDFTQLLDEFEGVSIYNPMKKTYVEQAPHDYVTWKALRGDPTDNIPKIITDGAASALMDDPDALKEFFNDPANKEAFRKNYSLIKFTTWSDEEAHGMTSSQPTKDWAPVRSTFEKYGFKSLLKDEAWGKFTATFDHLWGEYLLAMKIKLRELKSMIRTILTEGMTSFDGWNVGDWVKLPGGAVVQIASFEDTPSTGGSYVTCRTTDGRAQRADYMFADAVKPTPEEIKSWSKHKKSSARREADYYAKHGTRGEF